jgi:hypothetical protein
VFYDTHDEGVAEFIQFTRTAATLLADDDDDDDDDKKPLIGQKEGVESQPATSKTRGCSPKLFSFWNGMEFHNAFRHGVYCESVRRFLCDEDASPGELQFERVDFIRVPVSQGEEEEGGGRKYEAGIGGEGRNNGVNGEGESGGGGSGGSGAKDGDWRVWGEKGLRYWHLNAYYLPLCWKRGAGGTALPTADDEEGAVAGNSPCIVDRADLCTWMVEGIQRGIEYHGGGTFARPKEKGNELQEAPGEMTAGSWGYQSSKRARNS